MVSMVVFEAVVVVVEVVVEVFVLASGGVVVNGGGVVVNGGGVLIRLIRLSNGDSNRGLCNTDTGNGDNGKM